LGREAFEVTDKTNFDIYLEEQLQDAKFRKRFEEAGEAWEVALQLVALRKARGLSQRELADMVGTSQQQISRLESAAYQGHSLAMLRRVAAALNATLRVEVLPNEGRAEPMVAEKGGPYQT
jgi:ribosome-binding protein aMBF1 (putative translation factor)